MGIATFLCQFALHALDGGTEEEGDEALVCALNPFLAQPASFPKDYAWFILTL